MFQTLSSLALTATACLGLGACSQQAPAESGESGSQYSASALTNSEQPVSSGSSDERSAGSRSSGVEQDGRLFVLGDSYSVSPAFRSALAAQFPDTEIVFDSVGGSSLAEQLERLSERSDVRGWPLLILDGGLTDQRPLPEIRDIVALQEPRCDLWFYVEPVKRGYPNERLQKRRHRQIDRLMEEIEAETPGHAIVWNEALHAKAEGTMEDRFDIEEGIMPGSLRADTVHLNAAGYGYLAEIIAEKMRERNATDGC